jgi:hypothetical protein
MFAVSNMVQTRVHTVEMVTYLQFDGLNTGSQCMYMTVPVTALRTTFGIVFVN